MQININIPIRLLIQIQRTIKQLADDYHDLHREQLELIRQQTTVDKEKMKSYYQSDRKLYEEERKREIEEAVRQRGV
jgi:hypothetical protein